MRPSEQVALMSCMKNEGPFIVEWVAYHRAIGFEHIYIATNDCEDGTDLLLDRLQELGYVNHVQNELSDGSSPQVEGIRRVRQELETSHVDWLLHIDADEFLNITMGERNIHDILEFSKESDAIAFCWRPFGHNGVGYWNGGSVLNTFIRCQEAPSLRNVGHKTMYRLNSFASGIDHMPKEPTVPKPVLINSVGHVVMSDSLFHPTRARFRMDLADCTWQNACINHYAIRSQDAFLLKNYRGDGMNRKTKKYFLNSVFYRRHNQNRGEDKSILESWSNTDKLMQEMLSDDRVNELHHGSVTWLADLRYRILSPEQILTWSNV